MALNDLWTLTVEEPDAVRHEARLLGVDLDPGETHEGLRERVEAAKAGNYFAWTTTTWQREKAREAQKHEAAAKLAIVNGTSVDSMRAAIESVLQKTEREIPDLRRHLDEAIGQASAAVEQEIKNRAPSPQTWWDRSATFNGQPIPGGVFSGSMPVSVAPSGTPIPSTSAPTYPVQARHSAGRVELKIYKMPSGPEQIRAENRRVGEEIAKAPPDWAHPLAWRLAVMAVVESNNNRKDVTPFDDMYWRRSVAATLHAYHRARLDGLRPEPAMIKAVSRGYTNPLGKDVVEKLYDGIACRAYERGRSGLGGVR